MFTVHPPARHPYLGTRSACRASRALACVLAGTALLTTAACGDRTEPTTALPSTTAANGQALTQVDQLDAVVRAVALALSDPDLRQRVKNDMRRSPFPEQKLPLQTYLSGERGSVLRSGMAEASRRDVAEVAEFLRSLPPLEFYMPVLAHRAAWDGGDELIVAGQLMEHHTPVGYTLRGTRYPLSRFEPPAVPVLTIVPAETDFTTPVHPQRIRLVDEPGAALLVSGPPTHAIEADCNEPTALLECPETTTPGELYAVPGLYLTRSNLWETGESWVKGSPEIEAIVIAPDANGVATEITCASERISGHRYYNQNDDTWAGTALLLDSADIAAHGLNDGNGFIVQLWEDDDTSCEIVTDKPMWEWTRDLVLTLGSIWGGYECTNDPSISAGAQYSCDFATLFLVWYAFRNFRNVIETNDDYLGVAVLRNQVPSPGYPDYTHILIQDDDGSDRNGAIELRSHLIPAP